jgi:hypothetical protein
VSISAEFGIHIYLLLWRNASPGNSLPQFGNHSSTLKKPEQTSGMSLITSCWSPYVMKWSAPFLRSDNLCRSTQTACFQADISTAQYPLVKSRAAQSRPGDCAIDPTLQCTPAVGLTDHTTFFYSIQCFQRISTQFQSSVNAEYKGEQEGAGSPSTSYTDWFRIIRIKRRTVILLYILYMEWIRRFFWTVTNYSITDY